MFDFIYHIELRTGGIARTTPMRAIGLDCIDNCAGASDEQKVAELARSYTREAIETLAELMRSGNDERVRGTAAQALLDRGWGKPKVEVFSDEAGYVQALGAVAAELDEPPDNRLL